MLNQLETPPATTAFGQKLISHWLTSRQALLISWHQLLIKLTHKKNAECQRFKALDSFCQKLVDYLSQGHFQQYQLVELLLSTQNSPTFSAGVYPLLENNTYQLLSIYDNELETAIIAGKIQGLRQVLSLLAELLERRFVLEDKLLGALPKGYANAAISACPVTSLSSHQGKHYRT